MKAATKISIIVTFCLLYAAAYGVARSENWLIHRAGYYSDAGENRKVGGHYISSGDFGSPMLAPRISTAQGLATIFFWPATQAELVYWYLVEPRGSPWQKNLTWRSTGARLQCGFIFQLSVPRPVSSTLDNYP